MSDAINLKQDVMRLSRIKENVYDGVEVWADDVLIGSAPTGATLNNPYKVVFPWNTNQQGQTIANNIWSRLDGYVYNPYEADGALLDPAAQLGDLVRINGMRSVVGKKEPVMDALYASSIAAPQATEDDTEYDVQNVQQRLKKAVQSVSRAYATISVNVDNIIAEVTDGQGNYTVLNMNAQGVVVKGNSGQVSIKGSQIEAGSLVLTDNTAFTTVVGIASGAATDIYDIANGSYTGGTFINGQGIISPTISSPTITAGTITAATLFSPTIHASDFNIYMDQVSGGGGLNFYGYFDSSNPLFSITDLGTAPASVVLSSPATASQGSVRWHMNKTYVRGGIRLESTLSKDARIILEEGKTYGTLAQRSALSNPEAGQIFFVIS